MAPIQVLCQPPTYITFSSFKSLRCISVSNGRMATTPHPHHAKRAWSLNDLSSELIALILEQLRDIDAGSLAATRLLSRRFGEIATPIKYEYLHVNERILAPETQIYFPHAIQAVYAHTRHVVVRSNLDPEAVKCLLERIKRLLSVRWRYESSGRFWMPSDVLGFRSAQPNRTELYVDGLPLRDFNGELHDAYLRAIPTCMLVSLKMACPAPPLTTKLESLKQLLLSSRRLETFHYDDRGQGTRFAFAEGEELPAFKELVLRSYDWNHTTDEVNSHWDFSRIRHLQLVDVPMFEFLTTVPFGNFVHLHTLHCEDFSAHLPDRRQEATRGLYCFIQQIRALHVLKITCHTQLFPIDGLLRHSRSLEVLRFRDHVGFNEEHCRCPTMWIDDLNLLSKSLINLHSLELDMDVALCEPPLFMRALCQFRRLRTLTLHVQTVVRALEILHPGVDRDYEAAMTIFCTLMRGKQGVSWSRITINVGGWRRHMVRRLSEAWREQNERGVYAERCFVLEKGPLGDMMVREEMVIESN